MPLSLWSSTLFPLAKLLGRSGSRSRVNLHPVLQLQLSRSISTWSNNNSNYNYNHKSNLNLKLITPVRTIWKSPSSQFRRNTEHKSLSTSDPSRPSGYKELDVTFSNPKEAFKSKTTLEVFRAAVIFHLLTINLLVDHQQKLIKISRKLFGDVLFSKLMEKTFFGHFVAGTDEADIAPKIQRMRSFGVNAILDYSAEEDVPEDNPNLLMPPLPPHPNPDPPLPSAKGKKELTKYKDDITHTSSYDARRKKAVGRIYYYQNEAQCDRNMDIFLNSIKAVAGTTDCTGFAAIKMTAIAKPQLLLRLSEAIERVHAFVEYFTGVNDAVSNQKVKIDEIKKSLKKAAKEDPDVQAWLEDIDADSTGVINFLPWKSLLLAKKSLRESMQIPNMETGRMEPIIIHPFSDEETSALKNAVVRCHKIFQAAKSYDVRVMVDAEQTYLQPAISRIAVEMMKFYNTERATIYNTYQCYLKSAYHNIVVDMNQAHRQNFFFGAKLVRGAYMEQERQRAQNLDYEDPINPTYEATSAMYEKCIDECLQRIKISLLEGKPIPVRVMAASHNEDTVRFVINKMKEYGINRRENGVSFGQLYGMCDQISFPLGQSGYQAYKYVPYGPVLEVLPYLSRRAQENRGFFGKTGKERSLLRNELLRRLIRGQIIYTPTPK